MRSLCIVLVMLTSLGQPYFVSIFLEQFCEFHKISSQSFSQDSAIQFSVLSFSAPFLILHSRKYSPSAFLSYCLILGGFVMNILFLFQNSYASLLYSLVRLLFSLLLPCYIEMILLNTYADKQANILKMISFTYALIPSFVPLLLNYCLKVVSIKSCMSFLGIFSLLAGVLVFHFIKTPVLQQVSHDKEACSSSLWVSMRIVVYASVMAFPYLLLPGYTFFRYSIAEILGCTRDWENLAFTYSGILRMSISFLFAQKINQYISFKSLCFSVLPIFFGIFLSFLISGYLGVTLFYTGTACSLGILSILKGLIWNFCFTKKDLHKAKSIESFLVALFSNSSIFVFGSLIT